MASTVISSIHSALDNIELLENSSSDLSSSVLLKARLRGLKDMLKKLRTFLLCARKLGSDVNLQSSDNNRDKDGSLGSLLERITDVVCRNAPEIHPIDGIPSNVYDKIKKFECDIDSLVKEIYQGYIILSNYSWRSSCPTTNDVMDIADSILENLMDFTNGPLINTSAHYGVSIFYPFIVIDVIEALGEKIKFLQNFIRFATLQSVGHQQLEMLLTHSQAVVVNVAFLTAGLSGLNPNRSGFKELWERMQVKISDLLQTIKPIDPHVYQTYTQVLTSSKLSRGVHSQSLDVDNDSMIKIKDFTDSLLGDLWEILKESCPVIYVKDQLQMLYEELRFLRNSLKEGANRSDEKIKDLLRDVICDAGVIIFSLYQKNVERDLGLVDLLERIKILRAAFDVKFAEMSTFSYPKAHKQTHINFLLEKLMELTSSKADTNAHSHVKTITEELVFLRSFFGEIVELHKEQEELQALWDRVVEVAYKMEFLIDPLEVGEFSDSSSTLFESVTEDIQNIKTDALKISDSKRQDFKVKGVNRTSSRLPSQIIAPMANEVVGFDAEATSILDRLIRGSKQLRIITIVGMPGLGKTTLATKVYNDSSVMRHFHVRAWCHVSQVFNKRNVLLELLKQVVTELPDRFSEKTEQDLAEDFRRCLKGRTYLIFLDDVWDIQAWNELEASLPNDSNGSRIILTSRLHGVVPPALLDKEPCLLRQLTNEESWELLQKKLYSGNGFPPASYELGMQIAEKCKGLPLTIVIVAGLLATIEQEGWEEVLESLNSGIISSTEQCMNTIELSYKHLPNYLKLCLLYFGAFPQGQEVTVERLIWLWIAEGFVQNSVVKSLEDVATDYLTDLVGRSLIMTAKQRSMGGIKTCRIHDLLHDFCVTKAKEEDFFQLLKGYDELSAFSEPRYMRRLCIYSKPKHFKESKIFCPRVRSLLFFSQRERGDPDSVDISFVINIFKLLKVLDFEQIGLGGVFPSELKFLVQLKYLAIQGTLPVIPPCIGDLSNLETFILFPRGMLPSLPNAFWNLQKLRHVCIRRNNYNITGFYLPFKNLDNFSDLCELDSFSGAIMLSGLIMEKQMKKLPSIRKLKVRIVINGADAENLNKIVVPDFLCRLESLNFAPLNKFPDHIEPEIGFPKNLKKLTLARLRLPWNKISIIGELPNLEVLKLLEDSFSGETWEMEEGEFLELKFLKLASLDIVRWTDSDDQLPSLQKLVLENCRRLEEMPSCLESSPTLEMMEVSSCPESVSGLVQQIQEVQMDMGNPDVKVIIHRKSS